LYKRKDFARCGGRPWALPPDLASLSRKAGPKAFIVNPPRFREDPIKKPGRAIDCAGRAGVKYNVVKILKEAKSQ
jgi:hypothetical protein